MVQGMTEAEAKRQQQRRAWDAEHLRSIGTKLTPVELARLDAYCIRIRTTRYSLLRTLVIEELAAYERENRVTLTRNVVAQRAAAAERLRPSRPGWMLLPAVFRIKPPFRLWKTLWITRPSRASQVACRPPLTSVLLRGYQTKGGLQS